MKKKDQSSRNKIFVSSKVSLLIGFTFTFTIVFLIIFYLFYRYAEDVAMKGIEQQMLSMLSATAGGVNTDEFSALAKEGVIRADSYTDDPRYWRHVDWMARIARPIHNIQIYSYIQGTEPKEVIFIGSTGAVTTSPGGDPPPWGARFKEHYTSSGIGNANLLTGLDHLSIQNVPYADAWGKWLSGYGPIVTADGKKVGAIGIDIPFDYVEAAHQGVFDTITPLFWISYIFLFGLVYLATLFFTRPLTTFTQVAQKIADGNYDYDLNKLTRGPFRNEVTTLADVFQAMRDREQMLLRQVEELTIQIDEAKAKQQISEIVDNDDFRILQEKARKIRTERQEKQHGT